MKIRGYKILALMKKDIKISLGNKNLIFISALPVLFAIIYQAIFSSSDPEMLGISGNFVLLLCAIVNLSSTPISVLSMMVAEEKEKNTMRTLMLSDISAMEFLFSKTIVVLLIMEFVSTLIFFITAAPLEYFMMYILISTITGFAVIFFGGIIGLVAKDQMATGTYAAPFMMIFMLPPMTLHMEGTLSEISKIVPTTSFYAIVESIMSGTGMFFDGAWLSYLVICIWIILGVGLFAWVFRKTGVDN